MPRSDDTPPASAVTLLTLGGTIAMGGHENGIVSRLAGRDLIAGVTADDPPIQVRDLRSVSSAGLSFADLFDAVDAADEDVRRGAAGIVLTQGTDSLEETAFLVDSLWTHDVPFVVTGAMRNPTLPSADGPANVLAAVRVAAAQGARGRGVLVVFNDEIHAARFVRKTHSTNVATFASLDLGPLGHVVETRPHFLASTPRPEPVSRPPRENIAATRIALYTATLDDDGSMLDAIGRRCDGVVLAAFGVGHVASSLAPVIGELAARIPVVLTSRAGAGPVLTDTYAGFGSEHDLQERGLMNAGRLHPLKARVLLRLLVAGGAARADIAAAMASYGDA